MIAGFPFITSSFDADARAYIQTSGATATAEINHFVKAIKRLGLWNSMVCWPLRSSQNAGTGTTAYSLGGLGTYNGTLINGPTWQTNGIYINGQQGVQLISSFLNYPYGAGQYGVSSFAVANPLEWQLENSNLVFFGSSPSNNWKFESGNFEITTGVYGGNTIKLQMSMVDYNGKYANECLRLFGSPLITKNKYSYFGYTPSNIYQNCLLVVDNISSTTGEYAVLDETYGVLNSGIYTNSNIGCGGRTSNTKGIVSIVGYFSNNINASQHQQVLNIYKQTLGQGLGLP